MSVELCPTIDLSMASVALWNTVQSCLRTPGFTDAAICCVVNGTREFSTDVTEIHSNPVPYVFSEGALYAVLERFGPRRAIR